MKVGSPLFPDRERKRAQIHLCKRPNATPAECRGAGRSFTVDATPSFRRPSLLDQSLSPTRSPAHLLSALWSTSRTQAESPTPFRGELILERNVSTTIVRSTLSSTLPGVSKGVVVESGVAGRVSVPIGRVLGQDRSAVRT